MQLVTCVSNIDLRCQLTRRVHGHQSRVGKWCLTCARYPQPCPSPRSSTPRSSNTIYWVHGAFVYTIDPYDSLKLRMREISRIRYAFVHILSGVSNLCLTTSQAGIHLLDERSSLLRARLDAARERLRMTMNCISQAHALLW